MEENTQPRPEEQPEDKHQNLKEEQENKQVDTSQQQENATEQPNEDKIGNGVADDIYETLNQLKEAKEKAKQESISEEAKTEESTSFTSSTAEEETTLHQEDTRKPLNQKDAQEEKVLTEESSSTSSEEDMEPNSTEKVAVSLQDQINPTTQEEKQEQTSKDSSAVDTPPSVATAENNQEAISSESETTSTTAQPNASTEEDEPVDFGDDEQHEDQEDEEEVDFHEIYQGTSPENLYKRLLLITQEPYKRAFDEEVKALSDHFFDWMNQEREEALKQFIEKGGEEADFEFNLELNTKFLDALRTFRDKKNAFFEKQENERNTNLKAKKEVLDKLRALVEQAQPTTDINTLRALQDEWRAIGPVPKGDYREIINNYRTLIQRFFDARSIYFELRDLDRRKNEEAKSAIIEKAKELHEKKNLNEALKELRLLHEEYKHIGPVPKGKEKPMWEEFKSYSDLLYTKRQAYLEERKKDLEGNLAKKQEVLEEIKPFEEFTSSRIDEWNAKTEEINALQNRWKEIGPVPNEHAKEVNNSFWGTFKLFFKNKGAFFKTLESEREENLAKKKALLEEAKIFADKTEDGEAAKKLAALQRKWRDVGPLPKKDRAIQDEFKKICDGFFQARRKHSEDLQKEFEENYTKKRALIEELKQVTKENPLSEQKLTEIYNSYAQIGFVPREKVNEVSKEFDQAFSKALETSHDIKEEDQEAFALNLRLGLATQSEDARQDLKRMENGLKNKIKKMEDEIDLYQNNLSFFSNSRNAAALREEVEQKIEKHQKVLNGLKRKQKAIRQALKGGVKKPKAPEEGTPEKPSEEEAQAIASAKKSSEDQPHGYPNKEQTQEGGNENR